MHTLTITIESALGSRMKFQVEHEIHFDLRSEELDGLRGRISTVEAISAEPEDGQMCLVLAKLTLDSLIEALAPTIEDD